MAMTLPSPASSSSDDSSLPPPTPSDPNHTLLPNIAGMSSAQNTSASNATKQRKSARRANTAERRATHNAVERQRRETLNGRFLDLAALLPNLTQIRRPSKSAIVNSSIAHIHASRRHRLLASRQLRMMKAEADALRRELNEWRDRAGIPRLEEPVRGEGFGSILSGELEVLVVNGVGEADEDDMVGEYPDGGMVGGYGDDDYVEMEQPQQQQQMNHPQQPQQQQPQPLNINIQQAQYQQQQQQAMNPMIASPTAIAFDANPAMPAHHHAQAMGYDHPHNAYPTAPSYAPQFSGEPENVAKWMYQQQQQQVAAAQQQQQQHMMLNNAARRQSIHQQHPAAQAHPTYLASLPHVGGRERSASMGSFHSAHSVHSVHSAGSPPGSSHGSTGGTPPPPSAVSYDAFNEQGWMMGSPSPAMKAQVPVYVGGMMI